MLIDLGWYVREYDGDKLKSWTYRSGVQYVAIYNGDTPIGHYGDNKLTLLETMSEEIRCQCYLMYQVKSIRITYVIAFMPKEECLKYGGVIIGD